VLKLRKPCHIPLSDSYHKHMECDDWKPWSSHQPALLVVQKRLTLTTRASDRHLVFLQQALQCALKSAGFKTRVLDKFGEGSTLAGCTVLAVGADFPTLCQWADQLEMPKEMEVQRRSGELITAYRPFRMSGHHLGQRFVGFELPDAEESFFSPAEVLTILQGVAFKTRLSQNEMPSKEFPKLAELCQQHSVLALATESGAVESIIALHNEHEAAQILKHVQTVSLKVENVPFREIANYFGVHAAQYLLFISLYVRWLSYLAVAGVISHAFNWIMGSHMASAVPTQVYAALTAVWCTLFLAEWKRRASLLKYTLGDGQIDYSSCVIPPSNFYLATHGVNLDSDSAEAKVLVENGQKPTEGVGTYFVTISVMSTIFVCTLLLIQALLWFDDYVRTKTDNLVLTNLPLVLYLAVVQVCEGYYTTATLWLTMREGHVDFKEYLKSHAVKGCLFQLTNILGFYFYVAFWVQDLNYLESQLLTFMTVKQVIGFTVENVVPAVQRGLQSQASKESKGTSFKKRMNTAITKMHAMVELTGKKNIQQDSDEIMRKAFLTACEEQYAWPLPDLSAEYLQIAVHFAVTTMFALVFPLGSLLGVGPVLTAKKNRSLEIFEDESKAAATSKRWHYEGHVG